MPSFLKTSLIGCVGLCALAAASISPAVADAIPYGNPGKIAPTPVFTAAGNGDLIAYFFGSTASFNETLGAIDVTTGTALGANVFPNHSTALGATYDFGHVNAGDTLQFFINVSTTGLTFNSNPLLNTDMINHAYGTHFSGGMIGTPAVTVPAGTFVGFEDQLGGGDLNYNDETFVFANTNVMSNVPLPASAPMFGAALLALGAVGYGLKRKKSAATA